MTGTMAHGPCSALCGDFDVTPHVHMKYSHKIVLLNGYLLTPADVARDKVIFMNTASITEHSKLLRDKFASLGVQYACWLVLGSSMVLPVYAEVVYKPLSCPVRGNGPFIPVDNTTAPPATQPPSAPPIIVSAPRVNPNDNVSGNNAPPPPPPPQQRVQPPSQPAPPSTSPIIPSPSNSVNNTMANRSVNPGSLSEVLPSAKQLSDSMRVMPAVAMPDLSKKTEQVRINNQNTQCVDISLRPDPAQQSFSLVDFSGDGLIVSAVSNNHIQSVFAQAGYAQIDVSQAGRWCIPQATARALLLPTQGATTQAASLLVQMGHGLQLMSQDQWLAHQAAMKPLAAKTITTQSRSVKKLASKRSAKSFTNVAKSTPNLPPM
jgi:hypothetical protein